MKDKKDIFDLFRDNEHKLNELPSDRAWQRLEDRLENRRGRRRIKPGFRNWLSMAGVLLLLIAMISAISLVFKETPNKTAMVESAAATPLVLEEIGLYSDQTNVAYNISDYKKYLNRLNTNPILEGDPSKELRVQNKVFVALRNRSNKQLNNIASIESENKAINKKIEQPIATATPSEDESMLNGRTADVIASSEVTYDAPSAPAASQISSAGAPATMADNINNIESKEAAASDMAYDHETSIGAIGGDNEVADSDQIGIAQFQWLIGQWEAPSEKEKIANADTRAASQSTAAKKSKDLAPAAVPGFSVERSVEEWRQINASTITGKGYLLLNSDTIFTESMRISQIGKDLYYILSLDAKEPDRKYRLKSYSQEEIVFENENLTFPNQVILRPDIYNNNFITLLQNNTPTQLNSAQQQYYQKRNQISTEQIRRVMRRSQ